MAKSTVVQALKAADPVQIGAMCDVLDERDAQDARWGVQDHTPTRWLAILTEEVGEVARAINENDLANYEEECVQVAAVALAMVECLRRADWQ